MKKVLHVIDSLGVGGAEKLLVGIINELDEFENYVLVLRDPTVLRNDINLLSLKNLKTKSFRHALTKIAHVKKYMRERDFDIIHSHLYESNVLTRLSAPKKTKVFNSIHAVSSLASYNKSKASLWLEKLTYKKRHSLIHVSQTVADDFVKYVGFKGPSIVLYNFIEDVYFTNQPKPNFNYNNLKLVAVGNLREQKNYPYLINTFKQMPPNVSLDVYGEGNMRQGLQNEIDKHGLNVRLLGLRDNLYKILPQYDMFVMSSFFEGQPVALLEAMACGLPSLLSDIPVLREVGGEAALYFGIDDPANLVQKIKEVQRGQHDLAAMAAIGYHFVSEHARKVNYIAKLKSLYLK